MKILFDQCTPVPLRKFLILHEVATAYEQGWSELENGNLIQAAEDNGFDLILSTDKNLKYQQNLQDRKIGIVVLLESSWPALQKNLDDVIQKIDSASPGGYLEVSSKS